MIYNNLSGNSLISYLQNQLATANGAQDTNSAGTAVKNLPVNAITTAASKAALLTAGKSHQVTVASAALNQQQSTLAGDLRSAMQKSGVQLDSAVTFSLDSKGKLAVGGSDADRAKVAAFLAADTSKPNFSSKLTTLSQKADTLSASIQQRAAISQAARYASSPTGVMSLYATLSSRQESTPSVFSVSAASSAVSYPGMLAAQA
ncbi:MAG: hypothetical protein JWQ73_1788 [Variovorax sp.]|jgi:hypothetical protein|nr:hypothetical protein [Variovorax sp.]